MVVGGERVSAERLAEWLRLRTPLAHVYGLTETTVTSTVYHTGGRGPGWERRGRLPVGRPVAAARVHVVGPELEPVPAGAIGEVLVAGAGVARGYLGLPGPTAERFLPDPFGSEPGGRLYRTGDLARYLPDGNVEFVGRRDDQVNVRGFRVEPGEVEAALEAHPGVVQAVVVARADSAGAGRLVAHVLLATPGPGPDELRRFLRERLPDHLVPAVFVPAERFPLTPNGKIDRAALPEPPAERPELERAFTAPRDEVERRIAATWTAVLGLSPVGVHDDFFALGGHSLLAMRLVARLCHELGVELPLRTFFEAPTVAAVAALVAGGGLEAQEAITGTGGDLTLLDELIDEIEQLSDEEVQDRIATTT